MTPRRCSPMRAREFRRDVNVTVEIATRLERTPRGKTPLIVHRPPVHDALAPPRRRAAVHAVIVMQQPGWYLQRLRSACPAPKWRIGWRAAVRTLSQKFTSHEAAAARCVGARPAFPAAVRRASRPDTLIGRRGTRARGKVTASSISTDCELGDPPQWNRDPLTHRAAGDAARQRHRLSRRTRSRQHQVPVGAEPPPAPAACSRRRTRSPVIRATRWQSGADRFVDRAVPRGLGAQLDAARSSSASGSSTGASPGSCSAACARKLFATADGAAFRERWLKSIFRTGAHDRRQPVAFLVGQQSPDRRSGRCVRRGVHLAAVAADAPNGASVAATILEEECHRQNAPDGGNREQAFGYQTFVLDFLLIAGLAARARGEDFSPVYWRRARGHDRLPRLHDQRRGRAADDR